MSMRILYIYAFLLLSAGTLMSQSLGAYIEAAEKSYDNEDFYSSLQYYLEALDFDSTDTEITYMIAESARKFQSYELAEDFYTQVLSADSDSKFPKASYFLAQMQQMQGKYDMAKRNYELYISTAEGDDDFITAKSNKEIANIDWSLDMIQKPDASVEVTPYPGIINTQYSEISAIHDGDQIVYSSVQFLPKNRKEFGDQYISKILTSSEGNELGSDINNENLHTAHTAYNINRSKMYYTVCEYINGSEIRCDLYVRSVMGDGTYGEEIKLPSPINIDSFTTTQPNIGFDQSIGKEVLYFASDRDGGKGHLDLWAVVIDGIDSYGVPSNLNEINTKSDDLSPFFHHNSQVLYFSSDGYTNLGGYDIYRSVKNGSNYGKAVNLGAPTNSSFHDVFYSLDDKGEIGLFSSNRTGSQYIDENNKSCCYDIYQADISDFEINLNALTYDAKSLDSLEGVRVQLICAMTGDVMGEITNDMANDHKFKLERNKEYLIVSSKKGYGTDTLRLNTNTIFKSEDIVRKVYLQRTSLELQVFTFDEISNEALPGTTVRLIDMTDGTIQEIVITNESGHDFLFDVIPGHSYKLEATRDRYYSDSLEFVAKDDNGSGIIVKKLYLVRRDLNIYLPLALYFDNDHPDVRSNRLVTTQSYSETFDRYVVKKLDFRDKYTSKISSDKELAASRVNDFFETDVKGGYNTFLRFLDYISGQLQDGNSFDISIRGFASPRADTKYNLALSQRRVVSVQNELKEYQNGKLVPFINSGQLRITELSFGESLAPDNVSDVLYDRRNSVYSPEASKERRVEIVEIKEGGL